MINREITPEMNEAFTELMTKAADQYVGKGAGEKLEEIHILRPKDVHKASKSSRGRVRRNTRSKSASIL